MNKWQRWQREIIRIDEGKCDGCGFCILSCPEGVLRIVQGRPNE